MTMRILWYFHAYTHAQSHPITLWVEAANQMAAYNAIRRENPYIVRLQFIRSRRIG